MNRVFREPRRHAAEQAYGMTSKTPGRTFVDVHLAVVRRVEDLERALEALRLEQELEVRLAARPQEGDHGLVRLDLCFVDR